jgi:CRISPR-associated protein Cas1
MLTLPDFKEKQILFIRSKYCSEYKIKLWNDNVLYLEDNHIINRTPISKLFSIFIIGPISITSKIIKELRKNGVSLFFLDYNLKTYAKILAPAEGNYLLREKQYTFKNNLDFSKNLIKNKIENQCRLLEKQTSKKYFLIIFKIQQAKNRQELLGIEGNQSKNFFQQYFIDINWKARLPRTKIDVPNLLLDIGYHYLFNFIDTMLGLYGFDTYKGIYHQLFFQRRSLACDIMEPFRCIIDKAVVKNYNLKKINNNDFIKKQNAYAIKNSYYEKYSLLFIQAILEHKTEIYKYVKDFYYYIGKETKMPNFKIK